MLGAVILNWCFPSSVGCTENTEVRCRERKIRSDQDTSFIQIESKSPKEFAKKIRDGIGDLGEKMLLPITKRKAIRQRGLTSLYIHTEKRSGRATPEIFLLHYPSLGLPARPRPESPLLRLRSSMAVAENVKQNNSSCAIICEFWKKLQNMPVIWFKNWWLQQAYPVFGIIFFVALNFSLVESTDHIASFLYGRFQSRSCDDTTQVDKF